MIPRRRFRPVHLLREATQSALHKRLSGAPTSGMRTDFTCHGQPVIFLHNPKTGGNSLGTLLGVKRLSHTWASERLSPQSWHSHFSIVVVRDPFERFLSGYFSHILRPDMNGLVKHYGPQIKSISPSDYLSVLAANPKYGGHQTLWTDYPSVTKPRADLVLKLEASPTWDTALEAAGIDMKGRRLTHDNKSARGAVDPQAHLKLSDRAFDDLRGDVARYFRHDYTTFGYPIPKVA